MNKLLIAALCSLSLSAMANKPITLEPSGDTSGIIDQQNIQTALNSATGQKTRIRFSKGIFYILGGVSVDNFSGNIEGHSKRKTKIIAVGEGDPLKRNSVFLFTESDFSMSKLTIEIPSESSYLDSNPGLRVSDGGSALDIIGGEAKIEKVNIVSAGPFVDFGEESLETGILVTGCNGTLRIKDNDFTGLKRALIFNPLLPSNCNLRIVNNTFTETRGAIFALGGAPEAIDDNVLIKNNRFIDTLVGEMFFGFNVQFPISVISNKLSNQVAPGNPAIFTSGISSKLTIKDNSFLTDQQGPAIAIVGASDETVIKGNKINGKFVSESASIAIVQSDNVLITQNNFKKNEGVLGFDTLLANVGAYEIVESTNVTIRAEIHKRDNLENCQVLNIPFIDTSNIISQDLLQCELND